MQVLIVEDDPRLGDVLRRGLAEEGYGVTNCTNGDDALLQAESTPYDAIVLDIMLPGMNGCCRRHGPHGTRRGWPPSVRRR